MPYIFIAYWLLLTYIHESEVVINAFYKIQEAYGENHDCILDSS